MERVTFFANGHQNIIGEHSTTVELTTESFLTKSGTCIVGVQANLSLRRLGEDIKILASSIDTQIILRMKVEGFVEEIRGTGSPGLTYSDDISMVARTSSFECGRTLMANADKAASDLNRLFVKKLKNADTVIECELEFIT
ncbi:MAG: DUF371 domain-containing protein [Candidatus Thorarchaeota archaeon]|jgi:hypothetical protein